MNMSRSEKSVIPISFDFFISVRTLSNLQNKVYSEVQTSLQRLRESRAWDGCSQKTRDSRNLSERKVRHRVFHKGPYLAIFKLKGAKRTAFECCHVKSWRNWHEKCSFSLYSGHRGPPYMTSTNISDFFTPSPLFLVTYRNQLILFLLSAFWGPPPPPSSADVIYGSPHSERWFRHRRPWKTLLQLNAFWMKQERRMQNVRQSPLLPDGLECFVDNCWSSMLQVFV